MICYYFPPLRSSGTTRSLEFALRLPTFGWDPTVLTVADAKDRWLEGSEPLAPGVDTHRTTELDLHGAVEMLQGAASRVAKLLRADLTRNYFREFLCFPDAQIAWQTTLPGLRLARASDIIYASCSPFSSALSAVALKALTRRPLVLDFRDPWSLNRHHNESRLRVAATERAEAFVLRHCDRLVVNTEGAAALYRAKYPHLAERVLAIPNGYDSLLPARDDGRSPDSPFLVMHVGNFYGRRQPDNLLAALRELDAPSIQFVQVGSPFPSLRQYASSVNIRVIPTVPRMEALELMRSADLLYLAQGPIQSDVDIAVGAKTYEYLATGLPILAECPPGDNADLIRRYCPHGFVFSTPSVRDIADAVRAAAAQRAHRHSIVHPEFVRLYSRDRLTATLASTFDQITGRLPHTLASPR